MLALTPLSISQSAKPKTKLSAEESYEDKIKKRLFKQERNLKHNSGLEYRDPQEAQILGKNLSNGEKKVGKYGVSPFGFGEQSALAMGGKPMSRKATLPDIVTSSMMGPAAPLSSVEEILTRQDTLGKHSAVKEDSLGSNIAGPGLRGGGDDDRGSILGTHAATGTKDPSYSKFDPRLRSINTSETSKSNPTEESRGHTPNSVTAEPPSSPASLSKENLAKIDAAKEGFAPTARALRSHSESNDDVDDELATESDLETHVDDEDFDYAANPEEEDEGYASLRSQFKKVAVGKRKRDEVEGAAEDQAEGSTGLTEPSGSRNVSQIQTISLSDLNNGGKEAQQGKKVRFSDLASLQNTQETDNEMTGDAR